MGERKHTTEQMMKNCLSVSIVKRENEKENEVNYEADKGLKRNPDSRACDEADNEEDKGPKSTRCEAHNHMGQRKQTREQMMEQTWVQAIGQRMEWITEQTRDPDNRAADEATTKKA